MRSTLKALTVSAVVVSSLFLGNCFAATIDSVAEDMNDQAIEVTGSELVPGDKILIEVFKISDDGKINRDTDGLEGIKVAYAESDGSYSVKFKLPQNIESGNKMVAVKPLVGKYAEKQLDFYSSKSINDILDNWNEAVNNKDNSKMENVVNNPDAIKIILSPQLVSADKLTAEHNGKNMDSLTSQLLNLGNVASVEDLGNLKSGFVDAYVNFAINNLSSDSASKLILEFYDNIDTNKTESNVYNNIISEMSDDEKLSLINDALSKKTAGILNEDFVKLMYQRAVFSEFGKITYYKDVKKFIDLYNTAEYFNIDFSVYNTLKSTYEVDSKVLDKRSEYSDFPSFKTKYESWIKEQKTIEKKSEQKVSRPSSGSSGSKGTSSGGGGGIIPVHENIFNDIEGFEWAEEHIMNLYNKGVVNGMGNKSFAPSQTVTREQFVKMASVLCDMPVDAIDAGFDDVVKDEWYEKSINGAKQIGLISGQSENVFGVGENITRQDAALVMFNAIKISKPDVIEGLELNGLSFNDSGDVSSYAIYAISVLNKLGVINGDDKGYLMPLSNATRAEAAVMINKVLSLVD